MGIIRYVYRLNFSETILSLSYYRSFIVSRNSFEARRIVANSYTTEDKSLVLANQTNEKDRNTLIEQSIHKFCKNRDKF